MYTVRSEALKIQQFLKIDKSKKCQSNGLLIKQNVKEERIDVTPTNDCLFYFETHAEIKPTFACTWIPGHFFNFFDTANI